MALGDALKSKQKSAAESKSSIFVPMTPGERLIRIIDDSTEYRVYRLWINVKIGAGQEWRSFTLPDRDPIIEDAIKAGRARISARYALNVFDKTPVIRTPSGAVAYPNGNGVYIDPQTKAVITGAPEPCNEIKIAELSKTVLEALLTYDNRIRAVKNPEKTLRVWEIDWQFVIQGEGLNKRFTVLPGIDSSPLPDSVLSLPRHNFTEVYKPIPTEYIYRLLHGEDYATVMQDLSAPF